MIFYNKLKCHYSPNPTFVGFFVCGRMGRVGL